MDEGGGSGGTRRVNEVASVTIEDRMAEAPEEAQGEVVPDASAPRSRARSGRGVLTLMLIVLVFQTTVLPDTLGMKSLARVFNAFELFVFLLGALLALASGRVSRAPRFFVVSVLLALVGCTINILRNLTPESLGATASLLPWIAALSVPFMRSFDIKRAWALFYRFMLWGSSVSALEYAAVMSGVLPARPMETDRGVFLKGIFSTFFGLADGTVHFRMYGLFAEPGTYAMFLLPAILYAWIRGERKAVALFLGCLYFTDSLGGIASLIVVGATYVFWRSSKRSVGMLMTMGFVAVVMYVGSGALRERYLEKGASASVREDNATMFRENVVSIVTSNPFGLPLTGQSLTELENVNANYLGSNFEIYTIFVKGGILASLGYTILFVWMTWCSVRFILAGDSDPRRTRDASSAVAMICLPAMLLFVFQRETVLASALFAFLFVQPLILKGAEPVVRETHQVGRPRRPRNAPSTAPLLVQPP
jgi:hypothetical protein